MHACGRRCSSVQYGQVFPIVAPFPRGACARLAAAPDFHHETLALRRLGASIVRALTPVLGGR